MIYPEVSATVATNRFWLWFINDCCTTDLSSHLGCYFHTELLFIYGPSTFRFSTFKNCRAAQPPVQFSFPSLSLFLSLPWHRCRKWLTLFTAVWQKKPHIFKDTHSRRNKHARVPTPLTSTQLESMFQNALITSRLQSKQLFANTAQTDSLLTQHFSLLSPELHTQASLFLKLQKFSRIHFTFFPHFSLFSSPHKNLQRHPTPL